MKIDDRDRRVRDVRRHTYKVCLYTCAVALMIGVYAASECVVECYGVYIPLNVLDIKYVLPIIRAFTLNSTYSCQCLGSV